MTDRNILMETLSKEFKPETSENYELENQQNRNISLTFDIFGPSPVQSETKRWYHLRVI